MTSFELNEHLGYWRDSNKLNAYRAALNEVVRDGDHVIDLGTGTGLLGMLAVQAGAGHVTAYDVGDILGAARDLAQANGLADRMEFVKEFTTTVELPPADVIVCDQIGGLAFDAGVLEYFADAQERALKPGGTLVPAGFDLYLAPVQAPAPWAEIDDWSNDLGFDLAPARVLAQNTEYRIDGDQVTLCAPGAMIASISSSQNEPFRASCDWAVTEATTMHGLAGWFDAEMSPSVRMTNDPTNPKRMNRWLNYYPTPVATELVAGDHVAATIDIRPDTKMVNWNVAVNGASLGHQSTFLGQFMFDKPQAMAEDNAERIELIEQVLDLVKDGATDEVLVDLAMASDSFVSRKLAENFVKRLKKLTSA